MRSVHFRKGISERYFYPNCKYVLTRKLAYHKLLSCASTKDQSSLIDTHCWEPGAIEKIIIKIALCDLVAIWL